METHRQNLILREFINDDLKNILTKTGSFYDFKEMFTICRP